MAKITFGFMNALLLQFCDGGFLFGNRDLQIAVSAAELVDQFFFLIH